MSLPSWLKPGFFGLILGAGAWWIVLGAGLGWVSPSAAQKMADAQTQAAVVAIAAPDCVTRFEKQTNAVASWQALKKSADDFNQTDFIEKGGWLTAPGLKINPDFTDAVAGACATDLLALKTIDGVKLASSKS